MKKATGILDTGFQTVAGQAAPIADNRSSGVAQAVRLLAASFVYAAISRAGIHYRNHTVAIQLASDRRHGNKLIPQC